MQQSLYSFLLDFFPLTDDVAEQNRVLGDSLQRAGLELLNVASVGFPVMGKLEQVRILLQLSADLGYVDEAVLKYLENALRRAAENCRGGPDE